MRAKRKLTRANGRRNPVNNEELLGAYRDARRKLRGLIKKAKMNSWTELIASIEEDPWGLPYKLVMGRLGRSAPGLSEELGSNALEKLLATLFPEGEVHRPGEIWRDVEIPDDWGEVSVNEINEVLKKGNPRKAPGPDGITLGVLRRVPPELIGFVARTFTTCFREGVFPRIWKKAKLVLIPKGATNTITGEVRARPICLLNELGKLLERIIAGRLNNYIEVSAPATISSRQFGFRRGRSTVDALDAVVSSIKYWTKKNYYAISVGLDVKNAFNSIPWPIIRNALRNKEFPMYVRRLIDSYLYERSIVYPIRDGRLGVRSITRVFLRVPF